jgi:hypothetical protein
VDSSDGNFEIDSEAGDASINKKAGANNVCNWGQVIQCNLTSLPPNARRMVAHHLCQGNWERSNDHSNTVACYCFNHHPSNTIIIPRDGCYALPCQLGKSFLIVENTAIS